VWNGDQAFEEQIAVRVEGGTAPDLAVFPQPGLLSQFEADLVAADANTAASVDENYTADWKGYGTVNGTFYGTPLGANVKSFVWYSPKVFADNGWAIPTTWDELLTLSDEIAEATSVAPPWCVGFESGVATGWPGPTGWKTSCFASRTLRPTTSGQVRPSRVCRSTTPRSLRCSLKLRRSSRTLTTSATSPPSLRPPSLRVVRV
jgi:hypothetical protein